jgi:hypothetical protein
MPEREVENDVVSPWRRDAPLVIDGQRFAPDSYVVQIRRCAVIADPRGPAFSYSVLDGPPITDVFPMAEPPRAAPPRLAALRSQERQHDFELDIDGMHWRTRRGLLLTRIGDPPGHTTAHECAENLDAGQKKLARRRG